MEIIGGTFLLLIVVAAWLQIPEEEPNVRLARARHGKI